MFNFAASIKEGIPVRKRIVSFLLSVAMCLCLLPGRVDAAYFRDVGAHWARSYIVQLRLWRF